MEFRAKKYTILMNNEPLDIWIKNNEVKKAYFMDKKVALNLDKEVLDKIKDHPTKIVNGANLTDNMEFTKSVSKMMSQQLDMAIAKNDKKILSRFARSDLVPTNQKDNFIEAINSPTGLRAVATKAINKTNAIFQRLAKKIDRYFDKVKDKVANKKLDKYLEEYQLKEFNKAPPLKDIDLKQNVNAKLKDMAEDFVKQKGIKYLSDEKTSSKLYQNEFMQKAVIAGLSAVEAKTALAQEVYKNQTNEQIESKLNEMQQVKETIQIKDTTIEDLKKQLEVYQIKEAGKNESLEDFKLLTKDINAVDKIDILLENKEYLNASNEEKLKIEEKHLYQEPLQERAAEVKEIAVEVVKPIEKETVYERNAIVDFNSQPIKNELNNTWKDLQKINREQQAQNRDFMNISAVKFGGVSKTQLEKWQNFAVSKGADKEVVQKYMDASLRNAEQLKAAGVFKEVSQGEFKFKDQYAKEVLFKNVDKTNEEIAQLNKGVQKEITLNPQNELKERIADISSDKSFEKLLNENGQLDSQKLHQFADHLQNLATQLHTQEKANTVTMDDIKIAQSATQEREKDNSQQQERA